MLTIGKLAARAQVSAETLRYYEQENLIVPDGKSGAGYRLYRPDSLSRIHFIRQAQQCGFTIAEIRELLALQTGARACCGDVRRVALEKKLQLEGKIAVMKTMSKALDTLIVDCKVDEHPVAECPILAALTNANTANALRKPA